MNPTASSTGTGFISSVLSWVKQPFTSSGSALNWILFVGLLIVAAWFWNHVLLQLGDEI